MSVSITARNLARKWRVQSGPKSLREGVGENGAKWVRVGAVDTGLAFDINIHIHTEVVSGGSTVFSLFREHSIGISSIIYTIITI